MPRTEPKFLANNPEARKEWDYFENLSANLQAKKSSKVRTATKDIGPDLYVFSSRPTNWTRNDAEWTAPSVTGSQATITDSGFQLHIAGMRIHANAYSYSQIMIDDGSIPLQFYMNFNNTGYNEYNQATIAQKFMATWMYTPQNFANNHGNDGGWPDFSKLVTTVLAQDPKSNAATKMRLDFFRSYSGPDVLAVQVIIENLDKESYLETNVRFNITDAEVNYITDDGGRDGNGQDTLIELWAPRAIPDMTVGNYDSGQVYGWTNSYTYDEYPYWNDYGLAHRFFEGITQTRRVPYSAIDASLFSPRSTQTITEVPTDIKNRDAWILAIGVASVLLLVLALYEMSALRI
jgi:hypothetical protein